MNWYYSTYHWNRVIKAHILTNNHIRWGWYRTLCGITSINTEYRELLTPENAKRYNIQKCKHCLKLEQESK